VRASEQRECANTESETDRPTHDVTILTDQPGHFYHTNFGKGAAEVEFVAS